MTDSQPSRRDESLPLSAWQEIDGICDRFEKAWERDQAPHLEDYLVDDWPTEQQHALLRHLLIVDLDQRRRRNQQPSVAEYSQRFASFPQAINEAFSTAEESSAKTRIQNCQRRQAGPSSDAGIEQPNAGKTPAADSADGPHDDLPNDQLENSKNREATEIHEHAVPSRQIGPYKLLQHIAAGGMGTVWMADQEKPVRRRVALKLIKAGVAGKQVIARFEAERQALAMMNHQNIAKVLDAGTAEDGSPYFVMELVQGIPINQYCDRHKLTPTERLELFIPVCKAVQHAHQKGIIHRDLKPSNVLVSIDDGQPMAKVIDFGLAKALQHQTTLTDKTMFTEYGQVVGTVRYMSPEQATLDALDIDTRTDIYSLGAMLYELLAGSTPVDQDTLQKNALLKVLEIIREQEPPSPSHRLTSFSEQAHTISAHRQLAPHKLQQMLRGDLDCIVMKSLEKDRTRRYATANDLAEDIQRFLDGDMVEAWPPSSAYRLKKFCSKNRGLVTAAATILAVLCAGIVTSSWFALKAYQAAQNEASARQQAEELAKEKAELADRNQTVVDAFVAAFRSADPENEGVTSQMTALDVLEQALLKIEADEDLAKDGLTKATLLQAVGNSLFSLGKNQQAISAFEEALRLARASLGHEHVNTLTSMNNLASGYAGAGRIEEAIKLYQDVIRLRKSKLGSEHPDTLSSMNSLASVYYADERWQEALTLFEQALRLRTNILGRNHPDTLASMANVAACYSEVGRSEEALQLHEEALRLATATLDDAHPIRLGVMALVASSYSEAGRLSEAVALEELCLRLTSAKLGNEHPQTLMAMHNLGYTYRALGRLAEAIELWEEVLRVRRATLGDKHSGTLFTMGSLAGGYKLAGRLKDAIALYEEALSSTKARWGDKHANTASAMNNLALAYLAAGRLTEALPLEQEARALMEANLGPQHPYTVASVRAIQEGMLMNHDFSQARSLAAEWIDLLERSQQPDLPQLGRARTSLAEALLGIGNYTEASQQINLALNVDEMDELQLLRANSIHGAVLAAQGKWPAAEALLVNSAEALVSQLEETNIVGRWYVPRAHERVIAMYEAWGKPEEAAKWKAKLAEVNAEIERLRNHALPVEGDERPANGAGADEHAKGATTDTQSLPKWALGQ